MNTNFVIKLRAHIIAYSKASPLPNLYINSYQMPIPKGVKPHIITFARSNLATKKLAVFIILFFLRG